MELIGGFLTIAVIFFVGTAGSNLVLKTLCPTWSRKKHILWSSMIPPFGLWLLTTSVLLSSGIPSIRDGIGVFVPVITLTITLPFLGALIGIPTSWLVLKLTNWKEPNPANNVFK